MGLLTKARSGELHYLVYRTAGGLEPGRHVRVVGGAAPEWLAPCAYEVDTPYPDDPAATFLVDVEAQAAEERAAAQAFAPKPTAPLTKEELWRRYPWSRDAAAYELAVQVFGFPKPNVRGHFFNAGDDINIWPAGALDKWDADMLVMHERILLLLGKR